MRALKEKKVRSPLMEAELTKNEIREKIVKVIKEIGYTYVTIDLEGYRRGSMNEVIT